MTAQIFDAETMQAFNKTVIVIDQFRAKEGKVASLFAGRQPARVPLRVESGPAAAGRRPLPIGLAAIISRRRSPPVRPSRK